jgi:beta-lactamase class A
VHRWARVTMVAAAFLPSLLMLPASGAQAASSVCSSTANPAMAKKLSAAIKSALGGRKSTTAVGVYDRKHKLSCWVGSTRHYDSASTVKATVLGALLRKAIEQHRLLTTHEKSLAHAMITKSDNNATTALWKSVGRSRMQHFLNLVGMKNTKLGPGGYWGLTQITAHDEMLLLTKLTHSNSVLTDKARNYELYLMNHVTPSQRWGAPAGAPAGARIHVKNGWLPRSTHGWRVHSLGTFDGGGRDYMIVLLSYDNPSMAYGITSIERVARAIHHTLNPGQKSASRERTTPDPTWEIPDEQIPPQIP